jgi:hypothetical protein
MRTVGQKLTETWGRAVVVDNRTGASGIIGLDLAAKAPPDGHTLVVITAGHTGHPATQGNLPYDLLRDFAPITEMVTTFYLLACASFGRRADGSGTGCTGAQQARHSRLRHDRNGPNQSSRVGAVCRRRQDGLVHVPYKGSGQVLAELVAGQIHLTFATPLESLPYVRANQSAGARRELRDALARDAGFADRRRVGRAGLRGRAAGTASPRLPPRRPRGVGAEPVVRPRACARPMSWSGSRGAGSKQWARAPSSSARAC